jgi:hypothetical protein
MNAVEQDDQRQEQLQTVIRAIAAVAAHRRAKQSKGGVAVSRAKLQRQLDVWTSGIGEFTLDELLRELLANGQVCCASKHYWLPKRKLLVGAVIGIVASLFACGCGDVPLIGGLSRDCRLSPLVGCNSDERCVENRCLRVWDETCPTCQGWVRDESFLVCAPEAYCAKYAK